MQSKNLHLLHHNIFFIRTRQLATDQQHNHNCQWLINAPVYMRGTLLFLLTKNRPSYCIFIILLQVIDNYVISDAIYMITMITTRKHYDTWNILVRPTWCWGGEPERLKKRGRNMVQEQVFLRGEGGGGCI